MSERQTVVTTTSSSQVLIVTNGMDFLGTPAQHLGQTDAHSCFKINLSMQLILHAWMLEPEYWLVVTSE